MDDETITRLALAARAGDREAAASFVRATTGQVRRVLGYLSDRHVVDDLVQETYLRAFAALPRYGQRSPARLWLLSIARRVAADHVRTAQRSPRTSSLDTEQVAVRYSAHPSSAGWVELQQAIGALDLDRREAFVLTRVLGMSYDEAAEICQCAVGTIRSRVFRARGELLEILSDADDVASSNGR